mgnify:CR=1 FL=1
MQFHWKKISIPVVLFRVFDERDYVALLEPTSPLRKANDIDNALIGHIIDKMELESMLKMRRSGADATDHADSVLTSS